MFVYEIAQLKEDAVRRGNRRQMIDRLIARLDGSSELLNADPMFGSAFLKWRLPDQYRLIGKLERVSVNDAPEEILILLEVLPRNGGRYKRFIDRNHFHEIIDQYDGWVAEEKENAIEAFQASQRKPPRPPIPALPEEWSRYLFPGWVDTRGENPVFETRAWRSTAMAIPDRENLHSAVLEIVQDAERRRETLPVMTQAAENAVHLPSGMTLKYVSSRLDPSEGLPWTWFVYLLDLRRDSTGGAALGDPTWQRIRAALVAAGDPRPEEIRNILAREAATAYPSLLVWDSAAWQRSESTKTSDLALSAEEVAKLRNFEGFRGLPRLMEGRAGSGKSTLLFYFLADVITSWKKTSELDGKNREGKKALFVTQSARLLKEAENAISRLCRAGSMLHIGKAASGETSPCSLLTLYDLLRGDLEGAPASRFADRSVHGGYVSMSRFRRMFNGVRLGIQAGDPDHPFVLVHPDSRLTADLAWFVIRSYIKGRAALEPEENTATWLTPDEYEELPLGDRHVDPDLYRRVFNGVWDSWYRPLTIGEHGQDPILWDDQDLALSSLRESSRNRGEEHARSLADPGQFAVIVCDEGQDFTWLETRALLNHMALLGYDLRGITPAVGLPLLVAGDPFQTINPSGFRWEGVKDILNAALLSSNITIGEMKVKHDELVFNYRNVPDIARLANLVQAARCMLLKRETQSQTTWRGEGDGRAVARLLLDGSTALARALVDTDIEVIVPHRGEQDQPFMEGFFTALEEASKTGAYEARDLVVTPGEIKGLEREAVLVLGFGDFFANRFKSCRALKTAGGLWQPQLDGDETADLYDLEYFFNNLYVAVTRAREEVILADTQRGFADFWDRLHVSVEAWTRNNTTTFTWDDCRHEEHPFDRAYLRGGDPVVNAMDWRDRGERNRDADDMSRAAHWFGRATRRAEEGSLVGHDVEDLRRKRHECLAWSNYFIGKHADGARILRDHVGNRDLASEWFWQGACWDELVRTVPTQAAPQWLRRARLSDFAMKAGTTAEAGSVETVLADVLELLGEEEQVAGMAMGRGADRHPWAQLVRMFLAAVRKNLTSLSTPLVVVAFRFGNRLRGTYDVDPDCLAELAFACGFEDEAVQFWELARNTGHPRYHEIVAKRRPYPQNLQHWEMAGRRDRVVEEFQSATGRNPDDGWLQLEPENRKRVLRGLIAGGTRSVGDLGQILACTMVVGPAEAGVEVFRHAMVVEPDRLQRAGILRQAVQKALQMTARDRFNSGTTQIQPERRATDLVFGVATALMQEPVPVRGRD